MRFPAAYYLLLLYVTIMLKPLLPLVNDSLAHFFAEEKHIAVVHAKYGACHTSAEMASNAKDDSNKNQSSNTTGEEFSVHVAIAEFAYNIIQPSAHRQYFASLKYRLTTNFLAGNYPPPKFTL